MRGGRPQRPPRADVERAAVDLLQRRGGEILATARKHAATLDDAEDAYQRGLEILLGKAPTTDEDELVPWLKTVVKHEAWALRRQRERAAPLTEDGQLREGGNGHVAAPDEQAQRFERLRLGAEALGRLKPQEIRCLQLRAEGYSYQEICEITSWSYTKVNRCLTEGRRAFLERVAGIEGGTECERLAPILSAFADGEADADQVVALRGHMRSCLACRARLREFRQAPARVAALLPPLALVAGGGTLRGLLESVAGAFGQKTAALGERAHAAVELAGGQKAAAVVASAAALAGGGATVDRLAKGQRDARPAERRRDPPAAERRERPAAAVPPAAPAPGAGDGGPPSPAAPRPTPPPAPVPQPAPQPAPPRAPRPPPDPAAEFDPAAAAVPAAALAPAPAPPSQAPAAAASPRRRAGTAAPGAGASGEFTP